MAVETMKCERIEEAEGKTSNATILPPTTVIADESLSNIVVDDWV